MMDEDEDTNKNTHEFSYGRVSGVGGVAMKEWGIGLSVMVGYAAYQLFSVRFHLGPLWLAVEVLRKGWS